MTTNKLAIIGGSGLYDIMNLRKESFLNLKLPGANLQMKF